MTRRWTLLAGALALCLGAPQAAVRSRPQPSSPVRRARPSQPGPRSPTPRPRPCVT